MNFILFPTQLFELSYFPQEILNAQFYLVEHPRFYGKIDHMNFNKKKILLHKASCLAYVDAMKDSINISYVSKYPALKNTELMFFDPTDHVITQELIDLYSKRNVSITILESPNFMTSAQDLEIYYQKHKKSSSYSHSAFYIFQLKKHNIPYINKSYDTENRNPIPAHTALPKFPKPLDNAYVAKAKEFVEKEFHKNPGTTDHFVFPTTHQEAKKIFHDFIENKSRSFGTYQDAMVPEEPFLFHSLISSSINIGLLNPDYIIRTLITAYQDKKMGIHDYEAFMRQVIGWREYQRFIYLHLHKEIRHSNYFDNTRKLTPAWYDGLLGIPPVDDAIKTAFTHGYLHHIMRLMVMANFMNLCKIHPDEVYTWMMEFSVDSYEWVMIGNVYSMGMWSDGGLTMRKPYISSANYVQKMSGNRYGKGPWEHTWNALFYNFLMSNKSKLSKTIYIRNISYAMKMDGKKIADIHATSSEFIKKYTH